ncbi:hypothetical protein OPT61_g697 [Boeremia exigua]|uniref:Uncharacterized protein n=1 Tax=Boeremia exigua TaxID=749465 RepID=A0ACC2ISW4_9PLEO|nr:hypothetical protein OPT61_g697 [Boeremia exigua]
MSLSLSRRASREQLEPDVGPDAHRCGQCELMPQEQTVSDYEDTSACSNARDAAGEARDPLESHSPSAVTSLLAEEHTKDPMRATTFPINNTPATLKPTFFSRWGSISWDVLVAFVPLLFLVVAVLCITLNGKQVTAFGQDIKAFTLLSPTVFPIIYAAILGKVLRRIARYKAERGSTIGTLEQLIGSQSVFSSIERQIGLRQVDLLGVAIITAWLLSPLAGQASLRLLSTTLSESAIETTVHYHKIESFGKSTMIDYHMEEYYWSSYAPLYMTTLQFARQTFNESRDSFGNVRIPDIRSLGADTKASPHSYDWFPVSDSDSHSYTSLFGNPVVGIPSSGNVTFTIESNYWETQCGTFTDEILFKNNGSIPGGVGAVLEIASPSFDLVAWPTKDGDTTERFTYVTRSSMEGLRYTTCTADFRIVESEVGCRAGICDVHKMRISSRDVKSFLIMKHRFLDTIETFRLLQRFFPGVDMGPGYAIHSKTSSLTEQWILDPSLQNILTNFMTGWAAAEVSNLSQEEFNRHFQIAVNIFWDSSLGFNYWAVNATSLDAIHDAKSDTPWTSIPALGTRYDGEKYVCNFTFAIFTIAISVLLFVAAVSSAILGFVTKVPDILGYVSTLARDDPYFGKSVTSHHSGLEAARALRDTRVVIGDVNKDSHVGHIAFATVEERPERVTMRRMYD